MRPIAARQPCRRPAAALAALACTVLASASLACVAIRPAHGQTGSPETKRLLVLPTDNTGIDAPPAPIGTVLAAAEAAALPLGLHLGMSPEEVNARFAHPLASVAPSALGQVNYLGPDTVSGFTIGMTEAGSMKPQITSCFSPKSIIFFQFVARRLYAVLFAFAPDAHCPDASGAADDLFQHLLAIPETALPSEHYRLRGLNIVDVWDPTVTSVIHQRWGSQP
jgi:hypothetical protein